MIRAQEEVTHNENNGIVCVLVLSSMCIVLMSLLRTNLCVISSPHITLDPVVIFLMGKKLNRRLVKFLAQDQYLNLSHLTVQPEV